MAMAVVEGVVEYGRQLGRELGFPTANLPVDGALELSDGVYASRTTVGGSSYLSMSNLGENPSVGRVERRLETHIFGFEGSLYGRTIRVELLRKVRDEQCFSSVEELRRQIARDAETIRALDL